VTPTAMVGPETARAHGRCEANRGARVGYPHRPILWRHAPSSLSCALSRRPALTLTHWNPSPRRRAPFNRVPGGSRG